jgi:AGCS family alanine or glycine:cation symporter
MAILFCKNIQTEEKEMLEIITAVNDALNGFIWGVPAMTCIIGVGLYLAIRTGFLQVRKFGYAMKCTIGRIFKKTTASAGSLTPFQAVCTALAATVGTGNIAGVAGAIAIGGPGAIFWMWICAFLGMIIKFAEATLAVRCRVRDENGEWVGGPMYMIRQGLGEKWAWLAGVYSFFGIAAAFGVGNATQINAVISGVNEAIAFFGGTPSAVGNLIMGLLLAALIAFMLLGGLRRIGAIAETLVPLASAVYILLGFGVLIARFEALPNAFTISRTLYPLPVPRLNTSEPLFFTT